MSCSGSIHALEGLVILFERVLLVTGRVPSLLELSHSLRDVFILVILLSILICVHKLFKPTRAINLSPFSSPSYAAVAVGREYEIKGTKSGKAMGRMG